MDLGQGGLGPADRVRPVDSAARKAAPGPMAVRVLAAGSAAKAQIVFPVRAAKTVPAAKAEGIGVRRATSCRA